MMDVVSGAVIAVAMQREEAANLRQVSQGRRAQGQTRTKEDQGGDEQRAEGDHDDVSSARRRSNECEGAVEAVGMLPRSEERTSRMRMREKGKARAVEWTPPEGEHRRPQLHKARDTRSERSAIELKGKATVA